MWLFTTDGFYSTVMHPSDPALVVVRARVNADLQNLRQQLAPTYMTLTIHHTPDRDYAYRMVMPREVWSRYLMTYVMKMDYSNFKDAVHEQQDERRDAAYSDVWATMWGMQREREVSS